jgi:thioredoxin reductase (NADPH)
MPLSIGLRTVLCMAQHSTSNTYDCAVVGGGPAGLSAALVLGRARRRTVVIDAGRPINRTVAHSHGFFTRDGAAPSELAAIGYEQLAPYGVDVVDGTVTAARRGGGGFVLEVDGGLALSAQHVIVATGMRIDLPDLPGLADAWGKGAATCPYCHGWEVRDRPLGVLAVSPERASHLAVLLRQWSDDVTVYAQGTVIDEAPLAARGVVVERRPVAAVEQVKGEIEALTLADGSRSACGGLFLALEPRLDSVLLRQLGVELDPASGWPLADAAGKTAVEGVWVVGNAASPMYTIVESAASGARAAMMLNGLWSLAG